MNRKINISFLFLFLPVLVFSQRFAIIGDIQGASIYTYYVSNLVKSWNPEFIITCGDNYYPLQDSIDHQVGQFYHEFISPYYGNYGYGDTINRFFPSLGNHDYEALDTNEYRDYFTLPNNERYYDFVKGNVHLFALNSVLIEHDGTADTSLQAQWLQTQLAFSVSAYNIVYFHHPPYSSSYHGSSAYMRWPFKQWGATAVFSGNDHNYERSIIDSFPYFVCGTGGGSLYTIYDTIPGSQIHYSYKHGAILAEANDDSITFKFINVSDSLIEQYSIHHIQTDVNNDLVKNEFQVFQNYPNPFASKSIIKFFINKPGNVNIKAYNILGEDAGIITNESMTSGYHEIIWDARNLKSGIYYYCLYFEDTIIFKKAIIL